MSRADRNWRDPTGNNIESRITGEFLDKVVWEIPPSVRMMLELSFGWGGEPPMSNKEIGRRLDIDPIEASKMMGAAIQVVDKLRQRDGIDVDGYDGAFNMFRDRLPVAPQGAGFCDRHDCFTTGSGPTCLTCTCRVDQSRTGRPRKYCSEACRQAAHRERRKRSI